MPLLGAVGNASEYSFRGTYDKYPFYIDFGDIFLVEPGQTYTTNLKLVEGINYKVPISVSGDGEYYIGNIKFDKTFDNSYITFDQTPPTFDIAFPELDFSTLPTYIRNGNTIALRVFTDYEYGKAYSTTVTIGERDFTWIVTTKNAEKAQNFNFINQTNVGYSSEIISNTYTVQGLTDSFDYKADITSNEGLLSVNSGDFVTSSSIENGDILRLKLTSSNLNENTKNATVRIAVDQNPFLGLASTTWSITTLDSVPSSISIDQVNDAELNSEVLSNIVEIGGLSNDIEFDILILTQSEYSSYTKNRNGTYTTDINNSTALLSVNDGEFLKTTKIKNGDKLQLKFNTSFVWYETRIFYVIFKNTSRYTSSASWIVNNIGIEPRPDLNANNLIVAVPYQYDTKYKGKDVTNEVRSVSGITETVTNSNGNAGGGGVLTGNYDYTKSKYYTSSYKLMKGTTGSLTAHPYVTRSTVIGRSDFTLEMWVYLTGYNFNGTGMWLYEDFGSEISNKFGVILSGNGWWTSPGKIALNVFTSETQTIGTFIGETGSGNLFLLNQWNHVAITRSANTFTIYVNGINRGAINYSISIEKKSFFVGSGFFGYPPSNSEDIYIQDLRMYNRVKYLSNFNVADVTSIMK